MDWRLFYTNKLSRSISVEYGDELSFILAENIGLFTRATRILVNAVLQHYRDLAEEMIILLSLLVGLCEIKFLREKRKAHYKDP